MNRRTWIQSLFVTLPFFSTPSVARADTDIRRDGNWWRTLEATGRALIIVGLLDGMYLGKDMVLWGLKPGAGAKSCESLAVGAYEEMVAKYLSNVTAGQIRDGVDEFYSDYRNRNIMMFEAVWIVLQGIAGVPKAELDKSIESWRKNANRDIF